LQTGSEEKASWEVAFQAEGRIEKERIVARLVRLAPGAWGSLERFC
jgi:hypothetical protein